MNNKFRILAVCGGNGSWIFPMKKALMGNIEPRSLFSTPDDIQWNKNFQGIKLYKKHLGCEWMRPSVIVGAPDCGSSSMMALTRAKSFSNPLENDSFNVFFDQINYSRPNIFFMENLPKAKTAVESMEWLKDQYYLHYMTRSVTFFGNSQKGRIRLIVMGIRKDFKVNHKLIWKHITKPRKTGVKTTEELLRGLEKYSYRRGHVTELLDEEITIYAGKKMSLRDIKKFWDDHPNEKRFPAVDRNYTTAPGVYRNLPHEYPAVARKANRQFNQHGIQMSPRELARIQGIPDKFKIFTTCTRKRSKRYPHKHRNFWINKARTTVAKCPPYEMGLWIWESLNWIYSHDKLSLGNYTNNPSKSGRKRVRDPKPKYSIFID